MKIGILTWGSTGDIRPFIALAFGLKASGHEVNLVIFSADARDYSSIGEKNNLLITHVGNTDSEEYIKKLKLLSEILINKKLNHFKALKKILDLLFFPVVDELYTASKILCENNDIVIGHHIVYPLKIAAKKYNVPYISIVLCHSIAASKFVTPAELPNLGTWMNPFWWKLIRFIINNEYLKSINQLCIKEKSPLFRDVMEDAWESQELSLLAVSSVFCQKQTDWGNYREVCGFFNIPEEKEEWIMPEDLDRFLKSGTAPVYMTFGSASTFDPEKAKIAQLMIEAAKIAKVRAIIQAQWDEIQDIPEDPNIYRIIKAPHHLLFPHCFLVVHHGGSGTTQSTLYCGCPSVIIPHLGDQVFWGLELKRLGIVANIIPRKSLNPKKLASAINVVLANPVMKQKAREISEIMKKENGVGKAVEFIEKKYNIVS